MQAAIPLIAEWNTVTTAQLADAAAIDEAALLRVFDDKDAVLTAAMQAQVMTALDPTQVVQELQSIPLDQPLAARLVEAIHALDTYHGRMVTFLAPLHPAGTPQGQPAPEVAPPLNPAPDRSTPRTSGPLPAWTSSAKPSPDCCGQTRNTCDYQPQP